MELAPAHASEVLRRGELELLGRMAWSSNATFLVTASLDGVNVPAVYKLGSAVLKIINGAVVHEYDHFLAAR